MISGYENSKYYLFHDNSLQSQANKLAKFPQFETITLKHNNTNTEFSLLSNNTPILLDQHGFRVIAKFINEKKNKKYFYECILDSDGQIYLHEQKGKYYVLKSSQEEDLYDIKLNKQTALERAKRLKKILEKFGEEVAVKISPELFKEGNTITEDEEEAQKFFEALETPIKETRRYILEKTIQDNKNMRNYVIHSKNQNSKDRYKLINLSLLVGLLCFSVSYALAIIALTPLCWKIVERDAGYFITKQNSTVQSYLYVSSVVMLCVAIVLVRSLIASAEKSFDAKNIYNSKAPYPKNTISNNDFATQINNLIEQWNIEIIKLKKDTIKNISKMKFLYVNEAKIDLNKPLAQGKINRFAIGALLSIAIIISSFAIIAFYAKWMAIYFSGVKILHEQINGVAISLFPFIALTIGAVFISWMYFIEYNNIDLDANIAEKKIKKIIEYANDNDITNNNDADNKGVKCNAPFDKEYENENISVSIDVSQQAKSFDSNTSTIYQGKN